MADRVQDNSLFICNPLPPPIARIDCFRTFQSLVDNPSIFEDLGFVAPEGSFLAEPCISLNFTVDGTAEIMGTQVRRRRHFVVSAHIARTGRRFLGTKAILLTAITKQLSKTEQEEYPHPQHFKRLRR